MKLIFSFIVILILSIGNFFIILRNFKKIKKNITIVQDRGGFGNTFEICDLARYIFKSNYLFIFFFDSPRHNPYLPLLFTKNYIALRSSIRLKIFGRYYSIGMQESNKSQNLIIELLVCLIKIICKKRFFRNDDLRKKEIYNFSKHSGYEKFDFRHDKGSQWKGLYYYLVNIKKKKINFKPLEKKLSIKELNFFNKLKKNKNICIYLRNRKSKADKTNYLRDGSQSKEYIKMIKYILNKNYNVLLTGDEVFSKNQLDRININSKHKIYDVNDYSDDNRNLLRLLFVDLGEIYISESGGANYFGLYNKRSIHINTFPFCESLTCHNFILKKIIDPKKKIKLNKANIKNLFYHNFDLGKYKLLPNSSEELYRFIKRNIN